MCVSCEVNLTMSKAFKKNPSGYKDRIAGALENLLDLCLK